jgi:hypothetical protein
MARYKKSELKRKEDVHSTVEVPVNGGSAFFYKENV